MADNHNLKKRNVSAQEQDEMLEKLLQNRNQKLAEDDDSDLEDLPFRGKVYLPRRQKPDSWACIALQVFLVVGIFSLAYYAYYHFDHMHVNVLTAYAHLGYDTAQHELGNRYLHGT